MPHFLNVLSNYCEFLSNASVELWNASKYLSPHDKIYRIIYHFFFWKPGNIWTGALPGLLYTQGLRRTTPGCTFTQTMLWMAVPTPTKLCDELTLFQTPACSPNQVHDCCPESPLYDYGEYSLHISLRSLSCFLDFRLFSFLVLYLILVELSSSRSQESIQTM